MVEYNKIALENHSYVAKRSERIQNAKHFVLRLIQDGVEQRLNQQPDFCSS